MFDGLPVQFRYEGNIFSGEKRAELLVVPALSVRVSPEVAIVPCGVVPPPPPPRRHAAVRRSAAPAALRSAAAGRRPRRRLRRAAPVAELETAKSASPS